MSSKFLGADAMDADDASDDVIYKIDIPANRYDLLCLEGISKALNVFGASALPRVPPHGAARRRTPPEDDPEARDDARASFRRVRGAPRRQVRQGALQLLHRSSGQAPSEHLPPRTLVAIGTHDLSTIQGPFSYEAHPPRGHRVYPAEADPLVQRQGLMEHYKSDQKLKHFLHIIEGSAVYPVIYDANRTVLSLPPSSTARTAPSPSTRRTCSSSAPRRTSTRRRSCSTRS